MEAIADHLWNEEKLFFTPGDLGFPVFEARIGRIGLLICWEIWFPRLRASSASSVRTSSDSHRLRLDAATSHDASNTCMAAYLTMTAAHANNIFIATADRIGTERGSGFMGNSLIAGSNGSRSPESLRLPRTRSSTRTSILFKRARADLDQ